MPEIERISARSQTLDRMSHLIWEGFRVGTETSFMMALCPKLARLDISVPARCCPVLRGDLPTRRCGTEARMYAPILTSNGSPMPIRDGSWKLP